VKKNYMFTPGPTMVPAEVLLAEAAPMIHHRTKEFSQITADAVAGLQTLFGTEQDVYIMMGSGTSAMEAAVANVISPGDKAICVNGGKFGERWGDLCRAYGAEVVEITMEWGTSFTVAQAAAQLAAHPDARALYITQSETSTGALTDVQGIAALTRKTETLLAVDSITGVGVHEFEFDAWGVDIAVSGSQKGCMMPPGLAFIAASERAWGAIDACTSPRYYLDMRKMKKTWAKTTTPFTAAVSLIRALKKALDMIHNEGLANVQARHDLLARATRAATAALGLKPVSACPVNGVTAIYLPESVDVGALINTMRDDHGVTMAGGQEALKGRIIRIGHMGYVCEEDILVAVGVLEQALTKAGYAFEMGAGLTAAQKVLVNG